MNKDFHKITTEDILRINAYLDNYCKDKVEEAKRLSALKELEALEWWNGTNNMNNFYKKLQRYIDKRKKELV